MIDDSNNFEKMAQQFTLGLELQKERERKKNEDLMQQFNIYLDGEKNKKNELYENIMNYKSQPDSLDNSFQNSLNQYNNQIREAEDLRKMELERNLGGIQNLNLKPAMSLVDTLTGSNLAQNYDAPTGMQDSQKRVDGLTNNINQARNQASRVGIQGAQMQYQREKDIYGFKSEERDRKIKEMEAQAELSKNLTKDETNLRKELQGLPTTKKTQHVATAYNKIVKAGKDPSPAGDMSLIFGFMKIIDPGSTVREGEFANAANSTNASGKVQTLYNRVVSGERLNAKQRADFLEQARKLYSAQMQQQNKINDQYLELSNRLGYNGNNVVLNLFDEPGEPIQVKSSAPSQIQPGVVEDGMRFKGGNPADPSNWEAM